MVALIEVSGMFAICRLPPESPPPSWLFASTSFYSLTKTDDELSVVCLQRLVPTDLANCEKGWSCLKVQGPLDFSLTGIMASLAAPLAKAQISLFAVSTFDTDYILVKNEKIEEAINALKIEGHSVN